MHYSRGLASILCLVSVISLAACSTDPAPVVTPPKPGDRYHYTLNVENLRRIDTSARYVLWIQYKGDTAWSQKVPLGFSVLGLYDSIKFSDDLRLTRTPSEIARTLLTLEPDTGVTSPHSRLIAGVFDTVTLSAQLKTSDPDGIGDFQSATGAVTFTTRSPDTLRARSEFYLLRFSGDSAIPSVQGLPVAPLGWKYGLWAIDSNFFPIHTFFYGAFSDPHGPDSDASSDAYPLPGGSTRASLADAGGRILLTLEPDFLLPKPKSPSRIVLMQCQLDRFIHYNQTVELTNISQASMPSATFTLRKK